VLDPNRCECVRRMTSITVVVTRNVPGILAHGFHTVVTTEAGPAHLQVIHADNRQEVVLSMAGLAIVLSQDVRDRPGSRADAGALIVAAHAVPGRAFEDTLQMAVLASQVAVEAAQLIARGQMVELRSLDGRSRRCQE